MQDELMKIGVSIPAQLLAAFDQVIGKRGYSSRSEAIRDVIRGYLHDYESFSQTEAEQRRVITFVDNHEQQGLINLLTDIQHENAKIITLTIHTHLNAKRSLEVDVVRGTHRTCGALQKKWWCWAEFFKFECLSSRRWVLALRWTSEFQTPLIWLITDVLADLSKW
jgi:CopG family nickel-responsive transcriptional regulator